MALLVVSLEGVDTDECMSLSSRIEISGQQCLSNFLTPLVSLVRSPARTTLKARLMNQCSSGHDTMKRHGIRKGSKEQQPRIRIMEPWSHHSTKVAGFEALRVHVKLLCQVDGLGVCDIL